MFLHATPAHVHTHITYTYIRKYVHTGDTHTHLGEYDLLQNGFYTRFIHTQNKHRSILVLMMQWQNILCAILIHTMCTCTTHIYIHMNTHTHSGTTNLVAEWLLHTTYSHTYTLWFLRTTCSHTDIYTCI